MMEQGEMNELARQYMGMTGKLLLISISKAGLASNL